MSAQRTLATFVLCFATTVPSLHAQDAAADTAKPDPNQVLQTALKRMRALRTLRFRTTEAQNSAMTRILTKRMRGVGGALGAGAGEVAVRGALSNGVMQASLNDGGDDILVRRGRMIARNDTVGWRLRRNRLATGAPMPFVLDPERFFESLAGVSAKGLKVKSSQPTTYKDKEVLILGLTLRDQDAQEFALGGALPKLTTGMGGGMVMLRAMGGGMGPAVPMPNYIIDIALYVDPVTGLIHKVKTRTYEESDAAANFAVQIQGAGFPGGGGNDEKEEEEEEEVKEKDKQGRRIYKRGLPVRKLTEKLSRMDYDVVLSKHDAPKLITLDDVAKKLLRVNQ